MDFLTRLDPNAVLAIATALGTYIYHRVRGGTLRYLSQRDCTELATQIYNMSMAAAHQEPAFAPAAVALARAAVIERASAAKQTLSPVWLAALDETLRGLSHTARMFTPGVVRWDSLSESK